MECKILRTYKTFDKPSLVIINEIRDLIEGHELFEHKFFKDYAAGRLQDRVERKWLKQRQFLSKQFPSIYANIIANSTDLDFLRPFVRQLWEEFGNGRRDKIHYYQLLNTLYAKGITNNEIGNEPIAKGTQEVINTYQKWTKQENVIIAGAVFGFAIEPIIAMDMELSLEGLRKNKTLSEKDLIYFQDHATHDYGHSWEILDVVLPYIKQGKELELIKQGVSDMLNSRVKFYTECLT
jgi:pyrroloquinoline quinone (PQQ) biosynthesis protein C